MCHDLQTDPGAVYARPDPVVTRDMLTAREHLEWMRDGIPTELLAWLWGRIEGARGCDQPLTRMNVLGAMLFVTSSEALHEDDREAIRGMWQALWKRDRASATVMFNVEEER